MVSPAVHVWSGITAGASTTTTVNSRTGALSPKCPSTALTLILYVPGSTLVPAALVISPV